MPSSNKTPLGLNQWALGDLPDMEDFNRDNSVADTEISKRAVLSAAGATSWDSGNFPIRSGTWLPRIAGSTFAGSNAYLSQSGTWELNGNRIFCTGNLTISSKDAAMSGSVTIPLPQPQKSGYRGKMNFSIYERFTEVLSGIGALVNGGIATLYYKSASGTFSSLPVSLLANNTQIFFECDYPYLGD